MCAILKTTPTPQQKEQPMDTSGLTEKKMKKGKNGKRGSRFFSPSGDLVARTCATCDKILPVSSFPPAKNTKDGIGSNCKECTKNTQESYRKSGANRYSDRSPQEVATIMEQSYPDSLKECKSCAKVKDLSEFYHNPSYRTGVSPKCKSCSIEESKIYQRYRTSP